LFPYCAPGVIAAPKRRQLILRDLLQIDADIAGVQECDAGQLAALAPLGCLGWEHAYVRKAGGAADGCALFWRRGRFRAEAPPFELRLSGSFHELPGLDASVRHAVGSHQRIKDVLAKITTVAQGVVLRDLHVEGQRLLVANTHLFYHANANHIRLLQLHMLLTELAERAKLVEDGAGDVAVLLLGDLNARKGEFDPKYGLPQAAYRLIRDRAILSDDPDWLYTCWRPAEWATIASADVCICCHDLGTISGIGICPLCDGFGLGALVAAETNTGLLRLDLQLPLPMMDPNSQIKVTNFTAGFQECLDYTLLDERAFDVVHLIEPPTLAELKAETALPSTMFPSDHVPVITDIKYRVS